MGIVKVAIFPRQPAGPYPPDRPCAYPDCGTLLRTTNPGPCCAEHEATAFAAALLNALDKQAA